MRSALLLLLLAVPAAAQQSLPANGSELFHGLMHRLGYTPVDSPARAKAVVVFGPPPNPEFAAVCRRQIEAGGSVLIVADSFPGLAGCFPEPWRVSLDRRDRGPPAVSRLRFPQDRPVGLLGPPPNGGLPGLDVPDNVVVESPTSTLRWAGGRPEWLTTVAIDRLSGPLGVSLVGMPLAVGGVRPAGGRVLVVGSDAVFSNLLLAGRFADDADTGNLDFAVSVLRWLKPAGPGPVPCLFLDRGEVVTQFDAVNYTAALAADLPPIGPPPLSAFLTSEAQAKLTDAANEAFDRVQENDSLNRPFATPRRYRNAMRWLLGVLALVVAVALIRRGRAARQPKAEPPPKVAVGPTGTLARRREELLRGGDHTAAVRDYLIDLFREYGLPLDEYRHPRRMPRVEADRTTKDQLAKLWQAAYGPHPVSYTRWKELEPMIEEVRAAGAAGRWRFGRGRA